VLWVDDWPGNNASLVDAMRSLQIQVDLALTTREALSRLEQQEYDLIISDMARQEDGTSHPEAGLELIRAVRQSGNQTPIFIYAGRDAMRRREELETEGAALVTDKPSVVFSEAVRTITAPRS
jgi:CheY-like chemotaxis protein